MIVTICQIKCKQKFLLLCIFFSFKLNEFFLSAGKMNIDDWSVREKLVLACCVVRSGDQNWYEIFMSFIYSD